MGRLWVPLDVDFQDDERLIGVSIEAELLFVRSLARAGRRATERSPVALADVSSKLVDPHAAAAELVGLGLWRALGGDLFAVSAAMTREDVIAHQRGRITDAVRKAVLERDGEVCSVCPSTTDLEVDHFMPLARGGTSDRNNLWTLCGPHNRSKGSRDPYTWMREQGAAS